MPDVVPSALASPDLSLFTCSGTPIGSSKTVMLGLLVCSVWVWAIAIDKTLLLRAHPSAPWTISRPAFWSGQSLEDLYKTLAAKPGPSTGALFVAAMREWKRSFEGHARSFAGLQMRIEKVMDVAIAREVEQHGAAASGAWRRSARRAPSSACSARSGAS